MARPPRLKPLEARHRICGWINGAGRTRGLYAEQRGQFVQARITGFAMKPRYVLAPDWVGLGYAVQLIVTHWSPTWRVQGYRPALEGQGIGPRNPRKLIEARA